MSVIPRACILSVSGPDLTENEANFLNDAQPWGIILMGRSCVSRGQVRRLVDAIWSALQRPCLIFIDQEGGRVARLKAPEWPLFPPGKAYGDLYQRNPAAAMEAAYLGYRLIAHELAEIGIHADCAPVLDVPIPGAHDIIGDRAFGHDPEAVATLGGVILDGLKAGGVAGVIKHIPGHGRALADSHEALPHVKAGDNELAADFSTFTALAGAPMAMTAHIAYTQIDGETPATLSPRIISEVIRGRIGFDGLLMSDDLGMKALGGELGGRARAALAAGCDVGLHCAGFVRDQDTILAEMIEVAEASPVLSGKALNRARAAERAAGRADDIDVAASWARLRTLLPTFDPQLPEGI